MTIVLMDGYDPYQDWVIRTYGDLSRTKTITVRKGGRIRRVLRGEETACAENSKFRFWVRNKGFREQPPPGYLWRPADKIRGRHEPEMALYVPTGNKDIGSEYKKVALVENFFDIIHGVHVDIDGKNGKHAGQKRTYRTITETYAFLPREAVTKFLLSCTDCQRRPSSPVIKRSLTLQNNPETPTKKPKLETDISDTTISSANGHSETSLQTSPENLCKHDRTCPQLPLLHSTPLSHPVSGITLLDRSCLDLEGPHSFQGTLRDTPSSTDTSDSSLENLATMKPLRRSIEMSRKGIFERNDIYSGDRKRFPIFYPIPKRDGRKKNSVDEMFIHDLRKTASLQDEEEVGAVPDAESPEEDSPYNTNKDTDKLKMMLLAWNASGAGRNGEDMPEEAASLWSAYHHSPLSLSKQPPPTRASPTQDAASVHDETSSSGNKDDDEDEGEEEEEKIDPHKYDPERLKSFNMFVRLFVDENLDRIVPISKQPKEKIQAIIDSCTRQFPEFSERARKRIRTYLKSCRRNKRCRDGGPAWEPVRQSRPTPAHLTSVQAEQILAQACENESHNAKRMRLGMDPVTQPMPGGVTDSVVTTRAASATPDVRDKDIYSSPISVATEKPIKMETNSRPATPPSKPPMEPINMGSLSPNVVNGSTGIGTVVGSIPSVSTVAAAVAAAAAAPTAMYRPNFSQAFQRAAASYGAPGLFPLPCGLTNGPADLSMKTKPLLSHKLNPAEITAVRQLVTGYRESAAFLLRSADELEQLLRNQ